MLNQQRSFCLERGVDCHPTSADDRLGFAPSTEGALPINGLRHLAENGTSGWYIWCGEELSQAADFFVPMCASHVCEPYPELQKLLGLPRGYRFLLAPGYLDIWFDVSLLVQAEAHSS